MNDRENGREGSGISVLATWHDDDEDIYIYIYPWTPYFYIDPHKKYVYIHFFLFPPFLEIMCSVAGHCWRSRDKLIRDVLLWTPTHGRAKAGRPARTYIQQLCEDTGCCPEDLPRAMNDREEWRERLRDIRTTSATWWWWWWWWWLFLSSLFIYLRNSKKFKHQFTWEQRNISLRIITLNMLLWIFLFIHTFFLSGNFIKRPSVF